MKARYWFLTLIIGFLVSFGSASAVSNLTASENLAYYKLEAATVPYLDSTPTGADLDQATIVPTQTGGIIGFGQNFNTNQRISTNTGIGVGTSGSVNVWINTASEGMSSNMFFDANDGADRTFMYWYGNAAKYNFRIDGVDVFGGAMGPQGTGSWMMVTMTWTNTDQTLYLNGAQLATDTQTPASSAFTTTYVGCHNNGNDCWNGDIDELSIWDVALTGPQVSELYAGGSPGSLQQYPFAAPAAGSNISLAGSCPVGFGCNLSFNNSNGQWIYSWNDTLNSMQSTELKVYGTLGNVYSSIGTNTSTNFTGTVYIDTYPTYENSTTRAFSYLTDTNRTWPGAATTAMILSGANYAPAVLNHSVYGPNLVIAQPEGVFWAIMIIGTMVLMSFASPSSAIIMMLGGLFATSQLGLFAINPGTLMLLVLLGFIAIWRLSK